MNKFLPIIQSFDDIEKILKFFKKNFSIIGLEMTSVEKLTNKKIEDIEDIFNICNYKGYHFFISDFIAENLGVSKNKLMNEDKMLEILHSKDFLDYFNEYVYIVIGKKGSLDEERAFFKKYYSNLRYNNEIDLLKHILSCYDLENFILIETLKYHCIIKSLYTIDYLLYGKNYITISKLFKSKDGSFDYFDKLDTKSEQSHINEARNIINLIENVIKKKSAYQKILDIKVEKKDKNKKILMSKHMLIFKYTILLTMGNTGNNNMRIEDKLKTIQLYESDLKTFEDGYEYNSNIKELINGYDNLDKFLRIDDVKLDEKVLYEYCKEIYLNFDLIKYFFSNKTILGILEENPDDFIKLFKLSSKLPNIYSREYYIEYFMKYAIDENYEININSFEQYINYAVNTSFPLYEKMFFSLLYERFKSEEGDEASLNKIRNELIEYIDKNYEKIKSRYNSHVNLNEYNNFISEELLNKIKNKESIYKLMFDNCNIIKMHLNNETFDLCINYIKKSLIEENEENKKNEQILSKNVKLIYKLIKFIYDKEKG